MFFLKIVLACFLSFLYSYMQYIYYKKAGLAFPRAK